MRRRWARTSALFTLSALAAGCTLINAFDDLAPQGALSDGGPGVDASLPDTSGGPGDAGSDVADGSAPDTADAAPRGAIVIGGVAVVEAGADLPVLTALDPGTGVELLGAREAMNVAALLYDGKRDLWFIFESGGQGPFPLPTDPFYLHARTLDVYSGRWTELGKRQLPAGLSFTTTGQLAERIAYVAYGNEPDGGSDAGFDAGASVPPPFGLVVVNTSDPANMTVASVTALASSPAAVVGIRSPVNPAGGIAALGATTKSGTSNVSQITPVLVPAADPPAVEAPIVGPFATAGAAYGAVSVQGNTDVVVITRPFGASTTPATLAIFDPSANDPTQALVASGHFAFLDGNIKIPAFSKCDGVVFVVGTNQDLSLYAVSLEGAALPDPDGGATPLLPSTSAPTGHSGQGVYFEPYTSTVLTPFSQGNNFALTAFTLGGSPGHPTLTPRVYPHWNPPADLRPSFVAARTPLDFPCPTPPAAGDP